MFEDVRRVVTVIDVHGESRIESDGAPPLSITHPSSTRLTEIFTIDSLPADPQAGGDRAEYSFLMPPEGVLFRRATVPPDSVRFRDEQGNPRVPANDEGMHQTPTIDFIQVLEGELWLLMPNGEEAHLRAGDVVVQRGTVHTWRNRSDKPTHYFAVMVSATLPSGQHEIPYTVAPTSTS